MIGPLQKLGIFYFYRNNFSPILHPLIKERDVFCIMIFRYTINVCSYPWHFTMHSLIRNLWSYLDVANLKFWKYLAIIALDASVTIIVICLLLFVIMIETRIYVFYSVYLTFLSSCVRLLKPLSTYILTYSKIILFR